LADLGRIDEAIAQFTAALRVQPESIAAIQDLRAAESRRAQAFAGNSSTDVAKR
jgi:hypothetical protein